MKITELQLILKTLENLALSDNIHVNTKAIIVDLIKQIYKDLNNPIYIKYEEFKENK